MSENGTESDGYLKVHESDLRKVLLSLRQAAVFFESHNTMNGALHLAEPIWSPLTSSVVASRNRVADLLDGVNTPAPEPERPGPSGDTDAA